MIGFTENESKVLIPKFVINRNSDSEITGTVKICKTFVNFSDPFNSFNWF